MITQEILKTLLNYDPDTGVFTHLKSNNQVRVGSIAGCVNNQDGYVQIKINGKLYKAHRLAWLYVNGNLPPDQLDHINRNRADNRICNLRMATNAENHQNRSQQSNNKSGHTGVYWYKRYQKWKADITVNSKTISLGYFHDLATAIAARKASEQKYYTFQH